MNSKRMTPAECAGTFTCDLTDKSCLPCPIQEWCMANVFEPDTCEETFRQYLKQQDEGTL